MKPARHSLLFVLAVSIAVAAGSGNNSKAGNQSASTSPPTHFSGSTAGQKVDVPENGRSKDINATSFPDAAILGTSAGVVRRSSGQIDYGNYAGPIAKEAQGTPPAAGPAKVLRLPPRRHSHLGQLERIRRDG